MTSRFERLLISLMFALFAAGATLVIASAQSGTVPPIQTSSGCATCHSEFQTTGKMVHMVKQVVIPYSWMNGQSRVSPARA